MENNKHWFFGSKLNTVLLLILIILMIIALRWMYQQRNIYFKGFSSDAERWAKSENGAYEDYKKDKNESTYTYTNHGFSIELPKGFIPHDVQSETGPAISMDFPDKAQLIYVTNASWWEKNNIIDQTEYYGKEKVGNTTFDVYRYNNAHINDRFYWFKQGNVGYQFEGPNSRQYMETFSFVGWSQVQQYNQDNIFFSYPADVTLKSFVAPSGYTVLELIKKDSPSFISIHYAKKFTDGARAMNGCFELQTAKVTIGSNVFTKCSSQAEPSDIYVLSGNSNIVNIIINNFDGLTKIDDFIDFSSIKIN